MKKISFKKILIIVLILAVVCSSAYLVYSNYRYVSLGNYRYEKFWKNSKNFDVWFMGSSHMIYGVSPMQLYGEYGIKSFNLACPSGTIPVEFWTLQCALKKNTPKLIVLDTYHSAAEYKIISQEIKRHKDLDGIPFSFTKIKAVNDIFDSQRDRLIFGLGMEKYKYSIANYSEKKIFESSMGGGKRIGLADSRDFFYKSKKTKIKKETVGLVYLNKIIKMCKEKNIDLVLTGFPYYGKIANEQEGINTAKEIAEKSNIPFIDFRVGGDCELNLKIDFDDDGHLNSIGTRKTTDYIGHFIRSKYKIVDNNITKQNELFQKSLVKYNEYIEKECKKAKTLWEAILWVYDNNHELYLYENIARRTSKISAIKNINEIKKITYEEARDKYIHEDFDDDCCLIVKNKLKDKVIYKNLFRNGINIR